MRNGTFPTNRRFVAIIEKEKKINTPTGTLFDYDEHKKDTIRQRYYTDISRIANEKKSQGVIPEILNMFGDREQQRKCTKTRNSRKKNLFDRSLLLCK
jgi:hypothetical protein